MVRALLDANVLIALALDEHVHHEAADRWLQEQEDYATCPITQAALVRALLRLGSPTEEALAMLTGLTAGSRHEFWADDIAVDRVSLTGVLGHRQVSDAYLAGLARHYGGKLATFDKGLAGLHSDVAELVLPG